MEKVTSFDKPQDVAVLNKILESLSIRPQAHIVDSAEALAELTVKFNTLLSELETVGILRKS